MKARSICWQTALFLFSVAALLLGRAQVVCGQSALDGFDPHTNNEIEKTCCSRVINAPPGTLVDRLGNVFFRPFNGVGENTIKDAEFAAPGAFAFIPGHYYTSNYFSLGIIEYDGTGNVVAFYAVPSEFGGEVKGLAFGADGLLYATVSRGLAGFSVLALKSDGTVEASYSGSVYTAGNLSYGKIAIDSQYLYICGQNVLTRFRLGDPLSGETIYTENQIFDVKPLPNGNLFVASAYHVDEITTNGSFVRRIDPTGQYFTDIRGIEYNPATNILFVTHLGHSNFYFRIMCIDATTGALLNDVIFSYADDMFLDSAGNLLVGSRIENPTFFSQNLVQGTSLNGWQQMFVTQCPLLIVTPTPTGTPTPATPTPTSTPTPFVSISGKVTYCANSDPVAGVAMNLSGPSPAPSSMPTDAFGNYTLSNLTSGADYVVTPSKAPLTQGSPSINTVDVIATQRHYLNVAPLPPGCRRDAADVNGDDVIDTFDVVAIQRFFVGSPFGTANVGKYQFTPANRSYSGLISDQIDQNYDALVFGDVAAGFVHRPGGSSKAVVREN